LDLGCGYGRFTLHFGTVADEVVGCDISPKRINQAHREARRRGAHNVKFFVADLEGGIPPGPFGLIACMGVTLLIIDEEPFIELIGQMSQALEPGGFLITRDVLSKGDDNVIKDTESQIRNYRSVTAYENAFKKIGFKLVEKVDLGSSRTANNFYLWNKRND
jgi:SAM-dependent methyltransferase